MQNTLKATPHQVDTIFIESPPPVVRTRLDAITSEHEPVLIQVAADMDGPGRYARSWLVVTAEQLIILETEATGSTVQVPLRTVTAVRAEALVGGGRLDVEHRGSTWAQLYYSNTLAPKFAEIAAAINQLVRGESLSLPTRLEATRCARCGRILPEKDGVCPACIRRWETLRRLLGYIAPYRWRALVLVLLTSAGSLVSLVPPYVVKHIVDDVLAPVRPETQTGGFRLLALLVGVLLGVNLTMWVIEVVRRWLNTWVGFRAVEDIRKALFSSLQFLPLRYADKRKVGSLISRMTNDSDLVEIYMLFDLPFVFSNILMIAGIVVLLLHMNARLALLVLLPVPPIIIASSLIWNRLQLYWRRWSTRWSRLSSHLNESITGIRVIKAFAQEQREGRRFEVHNRDLQDVSVSAERSWLVFFMVTNFFVSFGTFFVWYFGGRQLLRQELELGALMAFNFYLMMLYRPLKWFGDFYSFMVRAFAGAERIFEIIDAPSEPYDRTGTEPVAVIAGRVTFQSVSFGYDPGKIILHDVDLDVRPGEMIGLVGCSGAGKSTLINLICRFYDVSRGSLSIDGVDIRDLRLETLRSQIGLVSQQSFLFNDTITENIRYGSPDAGFQDVLRAARAANAHEFIVRKADGYDMIVGEGGNKLSGGEKQRLAIARAILHDPRILILDEATSSLDTPTERKIQEAIRRLVAGRTTFAIAHRLSTLRSADRLVVLDNGRIAEIGSHADLLARQGFFYNLVRTQQVNTAMMASHSVAGPQTLTAGCW